MLSIAIPTYNYNVVSLVTEVLKQSLESQIAFEILVWDDASTLFREENDKLRNYHPSVCFFDSEQNLGRTLSRQKLAEKAQYDWILFLDADVFPVQKNFILNYVAQIRDDIPVVIGGLNYEDLLVDDSKTLRYFYGKERELADSSTRNKNPYNAIFSANLCIRKDVFLQYNFDQNQNVYGMDIYFAYQLFVHRVPVLHIDNPVYHQGIESNTVFFEKSMEAVRNRKKFLAHLDGIEQINSLLKHYKWLKKYHLAPLVYIAFLLFEPLLKKMILKKNPSLLSFDLYRLGVICDSKI